MSDPASDNPGMILLCVRCDHKEADIHPVMFVMVDEHEDGMFTGTISLGEGHFGALAGTTLGPFQRLRDMAKEAKAKGDAFLEAHGHLLSKDHK